MLPSPPRPTIPTESPALTCDKIGRWVVKLGLQLQQHKKNHFEIRKTAARKIVKKKKPTRTKNMSVIQEINR